MRDSIKEQREELRSIRTHINILFGFVAVLIGIIFTKGDSLSFIFSLGLFLSFLFICLAFIYSTLGLEKDEKKNNLLLGKINLFIRTSVIILFLSFIILIVNYWGFKI